MAAIAVLHNSWRHSGGAPSVELARATFSDPGRKDDLAMILACLFGGTLPFVGAVIACLVAYGVHRRFDERASRAAFFAVHVLLLLPLGTRARITFASALRGTAGGGGALSTRLCTRHAAAMGLMGTLHALQSCHYMGSLEAAIYLALRLVVETRLGVFFIPHMTAGHGEKCRERCTRGAARRDPNLKPGSGIAVQRPRAIADSV
jgi:hypothetical protein